MTRLVLLADALFVTGVVAGVIATFMLSLSIRKHVSVDRDLLWIGSGVVFGGAIIAILVACFIIAWQLADRS